MRAGAFLLQRAGNDQEIPKVQAQERTRRNRSDLRLIHKRLSEFFFNQWLKILRDHWFSCAGESTARALEVPQATLIRSGMSNAEAAMLHGQGRGRCALQEWRLRGRSVWNGRCNEGRVGDVRSEEHTSELQSQS